MTAYRIPKAALAFRIFHAAIALEQLFAIGYVWWCALSGRRGRLLRIAETSLIGEGVLVAANRGDCPLGPLQERIGDPVPLFELLLSPRAAKRAVPTLGAVAAGGLLLIICSRRDVRRPAEIGVAVLDRRRRGAGAPPRDARGDGIVGSIQPAQDIPPQALSSRRLWPTLTNKMVHADQAIRVYARYFEQS
jgi:hypothetical protein